MNPSSAARNTPTRPVWLDDDTLNMIAVCLAAVGPVDVFETFRKAREAAPADPVEAVRKAFRDLEGFDNCYAVPKEQADVAIKALGGFPLETT